MKTHSNPAMKIPVSRRQHGFTLVELLVVIAIIAVLAAAGFAAGTAAVNKARRVTALATATALESAINNFYTEYGTMPYDGASTVDETLQTDTGDGLEMVNVLLGLDETRDEPLNSRGVKFLSVKEGKANRNGVIYNTTGDRVEGLYDPWGGPFYVILDLDYDEQVKPQPQAGSPSNLNGRRVAVWSDGADAAEGGGSGKVGDDVKTW